MSASTTTPTRNTRRAAAKAGSSRSKTSSDVAATDRPPSKLDRLEALLLEPTGASIADLMVATGWQQHSVRGALAGAIKKRGLLVASDKIDGVRRYRAERPA